MHSSAYTCAQKFLALLLLPSITNLFLKILPDKQEHPAWRHFNLSGHKGLTFQFILCKWVRPYWQMSISGTRHFFHTTVLSAGRHISKQIVYSGQEERFAIKKAKQINNEIGGSTSSQYLLPRRSLSEAALILLDWCQLSKQSTCETCNRSVTTQRPTKLLMC